MSPDYTNKSKNGLLGVRPLLVVKPCPSDNYYPAFIMQINGGYKLVRSPSFRLFSKILCLMSYC